MRNNFDRVPENLDIVVLGYGYWGKKIVETLSFVPHRSTLIIEKNENIIIPASYSLIELASGLANKHLTTFCISTPEETHFDLVKKSLCSYKNVFVEKPLSLYKKEAEILCDLARKNNCCLYTDYIFLFDEFVLEIKEVLHSGVLGKVKKITSKRYSVGFYKPNVTVFDDLVIHDLYLARFFLQKKIEKFSISEVKKDINTIVESKVHFSIESAVIETHYSWIQPVAERTLVIEGEKGKIVWERDKSFFILYKQEVQTEIYIHKRRKSSLLLSIEKFLKLTNEETEDARIHRYQEYIDDIGMLESIREKAHSSF